MLTPTAYSNRLAKASLVTATMLQLPDVIGVEEIEKLAVLQAIAAQVNADVVAGGGTDPQYVAYLEEGNDVGGIDVGLLVKTSRVTVIGVSQFGKDTIFTSEGTVAVLLNDRPPLVLECAVDLDWGDALPLMVIVNHLRSMSSLSDPVEGPRVRAKRQAQAEYLARPDSGLSRRPTPMSCWPRWATITPTRSATATLTSWVRCGAIRLRPTRS